MSCRDLRTGSFPTDVVAYEDAICILGSFVIPPTHRAWEFGAFYGCFYLLRCFMCIEAGSFCFAGLDKCGVQLLCMIIQETN